MSQAAQVRLPPVDILIVEDRVRMAQQLAMLLQSWGATSARVAPSVTEGLSLLGAQPLPTLVLVDHLLGDGPGCVVALWLALRPSLRQGIRVALYTNSDVPEVMQSLRELVDELAQPGLRATQLLGDLPSATRAAAEERLTLARASSQELEALFHQMYDAYLSKRLPMESLRAQLVQLCQAQ